MSQQYGIRLRRVCFKSPKLLLDVNREGRCSNKQVQKTSTDQNTSVLQPHASLLQHAQNFIASLCYFSRQLVQPYHGQHKHGSNTLSPRLRWVPCFRTLGPGSDRSRDPHTWAHHSLTQASPALRAANRPPLWVLCNAVGSRDIEELCVCTASWENQWRPGAGKVFWKNFLGKWLPVFFRYLVHTQQGKEETPERCLSVSLPPSKQD